jgi:hypothetical protein
MFSVLVDRSGAEENSAARSIGRRREKNFGKMNGAGTESAEIQAI